MKTIQVRPVSERLARVMLMGMTMHPVLSLIFMPFIVSFVFTWRSWQSQPYFFWRPFTLASLTVAFVAAIFWPILGGQVLFQELIGDVDFVLFKTEATFEDLVGTVLFWTVSYIVWSAVMIPHNLARIAFMLAEANANSRQKLPFVPEQKHSE